MVTENSKKLCFKVILYYIPKLYSVSFSIGSLEQGTAISINSDG